MKELGAGLGAKGRGPADGGAPGCRGAVSIWGLPEDLEAPLT